MSGGGSKKGIKEIPSERTSLANPITFYRQRTGKYPNNAEQWWAMKRPPESGTQRPPKQYLEVFDPGLRHQVSMGNTPAAKGHYFLNAFHMDRGLVSGVPNIPVKSSNGKRPSAVAFYAGRVWYSGVFTTGFNTKIYYTQIIERPEQVQECYQSQDPTAEDLRDLLPSDGGVVTIPEVVQVHHMVAYGFDLFVFSSNGVWRIGGPNGASFRADDYSVSKLSGTPTVSNLSFVDVEGVPLWWNRSSINTLGPSEQGGVSVQSLTDQTIKTLYDNIPEESKFYAKGTYDALTKKVQFLYRSTPAPTEAEIFNYDRALVLDVRTGAFSPWSVDTSVRVVFKGLFTLEGESVTQEQHRVVVGLDEIVAGPDDVYTIVEFREIVQSKVKYIVNILDEDALPPPPSTDALIVDRVLRGADRVMVGANTVVRTR